MAKPKEKPLSRAARLKIVARHAAWAVVNRYTGDIRDVKLSRVQARKVARRGTECLDRIDIRVTGVRA